MSHASHNDIAQAIYLASLERGDKGEPAFLKKVVSFLSRHRLLSHSQAIFAQLEKIINIKEGRVVARVGSTENLNERTKKELEQILIKRYSAQEVVIEQKIDQRLIGGLRIEVNDEVLDLSFKNKIGKLQEYLIKK